jgi:xanthine dehydrogenase FAD-binding subunit
MSRREPMSSNEDYFVPASVDEAVRHLGGADATILAGGTDLMLQIRSRPDRQSPSCLVNIRRLDELRGVDQTGDAIRIGALTTLTDLLADKTIADQLPCLREMADQFASNQIRNLATIGGNICNASPAGDALVPLIVLDAEIELASLRGGECRTRNVKLADFLIGPGQTGIEPGELLTHVIVPRPRPGFVDGFRKIGVRPALEIAVVSVGLGGELRDNALYDVRAAFGAVAPRAVRGAATEAALEGRELTAETIAQAAVAVAEDIAPISDIRATSWYRGHLARAMIEEILTSVIADRD